MKKKNYCALCCRCTILQCQQRPAFVRILRLYILNHYWANPTKQWQKCSSHFSWALKTRQVDGAQCTINIWWLYQSRTLALRRNKKHLLLAIVLMDPVCHSAQNECKELREEKLCSGSVSYFCDLYSTRTIPGCLLAQHPLPPCVFPTLCVWTVKEIYLKTSGTKASRAESVPVCVHACVCVYVDGWVEVKMNSISFVWMGCLFR